MLFVLQAYVCIVVAAVMSTVYIVFARFDRLSFDRQEKFIRPAVERMKAFTQILDADIAKLLADRIKQLSEVPLSSTAKVCIFNMVVAVIVPGSAVSLFVSILRKVFLNLLIGWKGMCLGSLRSMFEAYMKLAEQLTGPLHIPPSYTLRAVFYPLAMLCEFLDLFSIDGLYSLLTVTCQGAKAPIELFVDSFVLGVFILFIQSDYTGWSSP
jgi:hypothetical protein